MREEFEQQLHQYNDTLRELLDPENTEDDARQIEAELRREVKAAARDSLTAPETQRKIVALQKEKLAVMDRLHEEFRHIEHPDEQRETPAMARPVSAEGENLSMEADNGRLVSITAGELLTDGEWGVTYATDASVPYDLRKRYAVESARQELRQLLDEQIILGEGESSATHAFKRETYQRIHERREAGDMPAGIIAEKMVRNYLKKLSIDSGVDFEILDSDVYQDVEQKIDFIIRRRAHHRGVRVDMGTQCGVQMTTATSEALLAHKQHQVERSKHRLRSADAVDDIVLVSIPLKDAAGIYARWRTQKAPGGPDKLWDDTTREAIFRGVLAGVFPAEEIEEAWVTICAHKEEPLAQAA
ncbi:MAG: hypothetical protein V1778_00845 [bacterium]